VTENVRIAGSDRWSGDRAGGAPPEVDIGRLVRGVLRRFYIVVLLVLAGAGLGYWLTTLFTPRYTSTASILLDPRLPSVFGASSDFASTYIDNGMISSVKLVIESSAVLDHVIDWERLAASPAVAARASTASPLSRWLHSLLGSRTPHAPDTPESRHAAALAKLRRALQVTRENLTYVIQVGVTALSPEKAQRLTEAVASAYLVEQIHIKAKQTQRDYEWLVSRVGKLRQGLTQSEQDVEAIRRKYNLTKTDYGGGLTTDQQAVTSLNAQLLTAEGDVASWLAAVQQAERVAHNKASLEGLPEVVSSPTISALRAQQVTLSQELAALQSHYGANYPQVVRTKRQLQVIDQEIGAEVGHIVSDLRNRYESAVTRRNLLRAQLHRITVEDQGAITAEGRVRLLGAQRQLAANKALYESLLGKLREVEQQKSRNDPEALIISHARLPSAPSFPKPAWFLGGGGVLGLLVGVMLTLFISIPRQALAEVSDVEGALALPVLTALPKLKPTHLVKAAHKSLAVSKYGIENSLRSVTERLPDPASWWRTSAANGFSVVKYFRDNPISPYAEGIRALRISMRIGSHGGARIVMITSAVCGEGKSSVAGALAVSCASAGLRTAFVDADFRRSSVRTLFGQPPANAKSASGKPVRTREVPLLQGLPLTVVEASRDAGFQPDVLGSVAFAEYVDDIMRTHDVVILDCPPVLAVSDPLAVARLADSLILVVDAGKTSLHTANLALRALRVVSAPLAGLVLNKVSTPKAAEYGYGYGSYGYGTYTPDVSSGADRDLPTAGKTS